MKTKTIFLSLFFMLASMGAWAQEKYEFAVLKKNAYGMYYRTENGTERFSFKMGEDEDAAQLKKLSELTAAGWEVYFVTDMAEDGYSTTYFLRKKKN